MKYHLIGVGGIGMSALARILVSQGASVTGSDRKGSHLLDQLEKEGVVVARSHNPALIQEGMVVVYSSDIQPDNSEWQKGKELGLPFLHRSELLGHLMRERAPLLVTGTHGKTTTTALLATVLVEAHLDPSFVIGGILCHSNTNGRWGKGPFFVAEADESDGSFLRTPAFGAIVTNFNLDHMNFWESEERLTAAFTQFFSQVIDEKLLFWCIDDSRLANMHPKGISYGFSSKAELHISNFEQVEEGIFFDLSFQGKKTRKIYLSLFGRHNALNGAAVFGLSLSLQIPEEKIRKAFSQFQGTKRRLEWKGKEGKVDFFDDYAHHPMEITATLKALRDRVKERRLIAIFQPHRFTRVKELISSFATAFSDADEVILTDIYSAGEEAIPEVTTAHLYRKMKEELGAKLHFFPRAHVENGVADLLLPLDAVISLGAGDIVQAIEPIQKRWKEKKKKFKVALLCGGKSTEHEVSLLSARNVASWADLSIYELTWFGIGKGGGWRVGKECPKNLPEEKEKIQGAIFEEFMRCDLAIPVMHGPHGEDGMIQGFLDTLGIPYVGCDYASSSLCMNKRFTKEIALLSGIPTAPYLLLSSDMDRTSLAEEVEKRLTFPVWVKPLRLGSSIGVSKVERAEELEEKVAIAFSYDSEILIEKHVEGKQIEFGVIGNYDLFVGPPCEILNEGDFVGYEQKYGEKAFPYQIPAAISEEEQKRGVELAKKVYRTLGCQGLARVDFFYDLSGKFWLNEVNPFPGCTDTSAFPKICEKASYPFAEVFDRLIACAFHRKRRMQ